MNICLLTKTTMAHGLGGVEVHVETLMRTIPAMGNTLTVLASRHPQGLEREVRAGAVIHYVNSSRPARYNASFFRAVNQKFQALHREKPFDVVWSEDFAAYGLDDARPPLISIMQGSGLQGLIRSEWNRIDSPGECIQFLIKFIPEAYLFYRLWYGITLKKSDAIVAISRETAEEYCREHGVQREKIHVVFDSVDVDQFSPQPELRRQWRDKYGARENQTVVMMAAVVHKQKGMHVGLDAFHGIAGRFPEVRLWIVGDGPHLPSLKAQAVALGVAERVIFFGAVQNDDMPAFYNASDIYLNPTLRHEGLTITTVEAMACGKPVVISRIGGTPSTVEEGISGYFVPPHQTEAIKNSLEKLLADPALRAKMGAAARVRATSHFSREQMARQFLSLSEELIRRGRHG